MNPSNINQHSNQGDDEIIARFQSFSTDKWTAWILNFINFQPCSPTLPLGNEELHHILIDVYHVLDKGAQIRFGQAIVDVFMSTQPFSSNAEQLYYLLQIIAHVNPVGAKRSIRQRLFAQLLKGLNYGGQDLHTTLLGVASESGIDDELVDFIQRSSLESSDFRFLIVCLRTLSKPGGSRAYAFIERLLPHLVPGERSVSLSRQLEDVVFRAGFYYLFEWVCNSTPRLALRYSTQIELINQILRDDIVPWNMLQSREHDVYATLLSARLHAGVHRFQAEELITIASTIHQIDDEKSIKEVLSVIWQMTKARWNVRPWDCIDLSENIYSRISREEQKILILTDEADVAERDNAHFEREYQLLLSPMTELPKSYLVGLPRIPHIGSSVASSKTEHHTPSANSIPYINRNAYV